jgi:hypothetical protein
MTGCMGTTFTSEDKDRDPREIAQNLYRGLRVHCCDLEELIESASGTFTEKELKRLDKAITVMKVGFKIMKKVTRGTKSSRKVVRLIASQR